MPESSSKPISYSKDKLAILLLSLHNKKNLRHVIEQALHYSNHVIVVDNESIDKNLEKIKDLPITVLINHYNHGKNSSLLRGFRYCQNLHLKALCTIDLAQQFSIQQIPKMMRYLQSHPDHIIIGSLKQFSKLHKKRNSSTLIDRIVSFAAKQKITDTLSGFRLYPAKFLNQNFIQYSRKQTTLESEILVDAAMQGIPTTVLQLEQDESSTTKTNKSIKLADKSKIISRIGWKILTHGRNHSKMQNIINNKKIE